MDSGIKIDLILLLLLLSVLHHALYQVYLSAEGWRYVIWLIKIYYDGLDLIAVSLSFFAHFRF
jgi:hypothetical protein